MISYYITAFVGVIFGYFLACLMMMAKRNTKYELMDNGEYLEKDLDYKIGQEDDGEY